MEQREKNIIAIIAKKDTISSKEILEGINFSVSQSTLKRILAKLIVENYIIPIGQGRATKYTLSPVYNVFRPIDMDEYYQKEIDDRKIQESFNFSIINDVFMKNSLFTNDELLKLNELQKKFTDNISQLSTTNYKKEFERLAIDLSWKSSQIEGNTYSLLETERLLKERETAAGKTKEDAIMLLNHKEALDFIIDNPDYLHPLSVAKIEDIHSILTKELSVARNLRKSRVGISGTNYKPLDNEFQIKEALEDTCELINNKSNIAVR